MRKGRGKDIPVVTRCTAFLEFSLIVGGDADGGGAASSSLLPAATVAGGGATAAAASPTLPTGQPICRLEFDLCAGDKCPKASENFRQLVSGPVTVGEKRNARTAHYRGTSVLRCTSEMIQCGDTANSADGKTQDTVFGALIEDEVCGAVPHTFGVLSLVNAGPNSNGSQFAIIATEESETLPHLDSRHVSLGFLKGGEEAKDGLRRLHETACSLVEDRTGRMAQQQIIISDCGIVPE